MPSVAEFLVERLSNAGLKHIFAAPGPFINPFLEQVKKLNLIDLTSLIDENHAAIAADSYARTSGIGCVCVDYNAGALKTCSAIAGSYAERSPVIVISGAPSIKDRNDDHVFYHVVKNFDNQLKIFKSLTCSSVSLDDPTTAGWNIDQSLEYLACKKQPVYIELPLDISSQPLRYDVYRQGTPLQSPTNEENLAEAFSEIVQLIQDSRMPMIIAGVQINRFNLGDQLVRFAEKYNIVLAATLLSKGFVSEKNRLFQGVFSGKEFSDPKLISMIEESDCLIVLGDLPTDLHFGFQSQKFVKKNMALCSAQGIKIKNHSYKDINFLDFCSRLFKSEFNKKEMQTDLSVRSEDKFVPEDCKITPSRFFERVQEVIKDDILIISDTGNVLKHTSSLRVSQNNFLSSAFYSNKDFPIPAILGLTKAKPNLRSFVFVSEKTFCMSGSILDLINKEKTNSIIFILSNISCEENKIDECSEINLKYEKIMEMIGGGQTFRVETEKEFCLNIDMALRSKALCLFQVIF